MARRQVADAPSLEADGEERDDAIIGAMFVRSLLALTVAVGVGGAAWWVWQVSHRTPPVTKAEAKEFKTSGRPRPTVSPPKAPIVDVTAAAGIDFTQDAGKAGEKLLPETMGGGVAWLDFDGDGDQDLLLVNSTSWPWTPVAADRTRPPPTSRLYRNDGGKFADVTAGSGLDVALYGQGVAVGDFDNDGKPDVYLTAVDPSGSRGANRLFRNLGGGKFADVTGAAGVAGLPGNWSTSAAFVDVDNDGRLDLVVCNYIRWSRKLDLEQDFRLAGGSRAYGRPQEFRGAVPYLFRNLGGGRFAEVAAQAGLAVFDPATSAPLPKSLGIVPVDIDGDGWMDLVIANDTVQNMLFRNRGNGTFEELGVSSGLAFDTNGNARGAMGIDAAWFRADGRTLGVGIGNFANEPTALYINLTGRRLLFTDAAVACGIGPQSRRFLKFGLFFLDYDLDGRLDLFQANGHLEEEIAKVERSQTYAQAAQLFWNAGPNQPTEFQEIGPDEAGPDLFKPMVGRGAAYADFDGDGDLDWVVTASGGAARLYRNDQATGHAWVRLRLVGNGTTSNRDAIGATVELKAGGKTQRRQVAPARSYLSQVELPLTFGLGTAAKVDSLTVRWPDGKEQALAGVPLRKLTTVTQPPK